MYLKSVRQSCELQTPYSLHSTPKTFDGGSGAKTIFRQHKIKMPGTKKSFRNCSGMVVEGPDCNKSTTTHRMHTSRKEYELNSLVEIRNIPGVVSALVCIQAVLRIPTEDFKVQLLHCW